MPKFCRCCESYGISAFFSLTPDQIKKWSYLEFSVMQAVNWKIHVTFKVHGKGTELFGDGFAIWYAKERMQPGPVFGSKDNFSVIELY
ncbi:vesicular integral-membrane protein VIP36-like isoform X2 [Glossina fuscipes]|uniref:Vesicular integral-membrane protein VIP36-like isoform X2 n=1 Tax=Glossina fuscipes TaxID=7396 RepID=A0A9C6DWS2_9MUSC|nr:vesicular integral-membrane protein VIP36-like isoform X2 [Glossina fuscipes]